MWKFECFTISIVAVLGNDFLISHLTGGIGEAVAAAVSSERDIVVKRLAVSCVPRSGKPDELLELFGINAHHIVTSVKELLKL